MSNTLERKLQNIEGSNFFDYLLPEKQGVTQIQRYYKTNKTFYRLLHNSDGFLHMGISYNSKYHKSDLLNSIRIINDYIQTNSVQHILELGYGRGANLDFLANKNLTSKFYGIDLSTKPLKKYERSNIDYLQGDYHDLSEIRNNLDLIYGIETICHSDNLQRLFKSITTQLKSKGTFINFDGYYLKERKDLTEKESLCCTYTEKGMSVDKFQNLDNFEEVVKSNGLELIERINFSKNILPSLNRFEKLARIYFEIPLIRKVVNRLFPEMFIRNALSGYLMPELVKNNIAGYYYHIFQKVN